MDASVVPDAISSVREELLAARRAVDLAQTKVDRAEAHQLSAMDVALAAVSTAEAKVALAEAKVALAESKVALAESQVTLVEASGDADRIVYSKRDWSNAQDGLTNAQSLLKIAIRRLSDSIPGLHVFKCSSQYLFTLKVPPT
jgi:hypothetical protein